MCNPNVDYNVYDEEITYQDEMDARITERGIGWVPCDYCEGEDTDEY